MSMPNSTQFLRRRWMQQLCGVVLAHGLPHAALAHGAKAGTIRIDHPYATPTPTEGSPGAVYFRTLSNAGDQDDRLLSARAPICERIELHAITLDGDVMRMRAQPSLLVAAHGALPMRHGGRYHLMLHGLRQALKEGDRFPLELNFERGGRVNVTVWVQQPRNADGDATEHHH
jgi:copper(I)-binding protein